MAKNSFRVPAEILRKNVMKDEIRDLNAEFQRHGGLVQYRSTKKGGVFLLSHSNTDYLDNFRVRLLYSLGILKEKDVPEEYKEVIEKYLIQRGIKPPKEEHKKVILTEDEIINKVPVHRLEQSEKSKMEEIKRRFPVKKVYQKHYVPPEVKPFYQHVKESLIKGAVDDGEIIKMAYDKNMDEEWIKMLKKLLWNNKCIAPPEECPHKKKRMRLEEMMKACFDNGEKCEYLQSPFSNLYQTWKNNMEKMYGEFTNKKVEVVGKISEYYPIEREGDKHFKMLIYDTLIRKYGKKGSYKRTRKVWIKIPFDKLREVSGYSPIHRDDIVRFTGKMIHHKFFHDYWVINIDEMRIVEVKGTEEIEIPKSVKKP